jgi:hypothetical protein
MLKLLKVMMCMCSVNNPLSQDPLQQCRIYSMQVLSSCFYQVLALFKLKRVPVLPAHADTLSHALK